MTTFYRDHAVFVGSAELHVDDRAYRLDDLQLVWHHRNRRGVHGAAIIIARLAIVVVALGAFAVAGMAMRDVSFTEYDNTMVLAGALLAVLLAGTVGLFLVEGAITLIERTYQKGVSEHQIWARYFDHDVLLFATRDKLRFGKVYRALQRAIERREF